MKFADQLFCTKSWLAVAPAVACKAGSEPAVFTLNTELQTDSDDILDFLDETDDLQDLTAKAITPWKILITDDDKNVHDTTLLALHGVKLLGRPLEFLHAFSAKQAQQVLSENPDTALILLDVVMETVDAGLHLVDVIRNEMQLPNLRIVLRTGQPGYAPEQDVNHRYGIDGYTTKSKLTRTLLISVLTDALDNSHPTSMAN